MDASGHQLHAYGARSIPMRLWNNRIIHFTFIVLDITRPILSLGQLRVSGFCLQIDQQRAFIPHGHLRLGLLESNRLCYLPVRLNESVIWPRALQEQINVVQKSLSDGTPEWTLVEWCGVRQSRLASWCQDHG